jgi:UrcA family protein
MRRNEGRFIMTTPMKKNIRSSRRLALMLTLASVATGTTFVGTVVALPSPAHAAQPEGFKSEMVRYRDLDLANEEGAAMLRKRIYRAARRVCNDNGSPLVSHHRLQKACIKETARNGYAQADRKIAQYRVTRLATD